jgi:hypothetical protein
MKKIILNTIFILALLLSNFVISQKLSVNIITKNNITYIDSQDYTIKNNFIIEFNTFNNKYIFPLFNITNDYIENLKNEKSVDIFEIEELIHSDYNGSVYYLFYDENNILCKTDYTTPARYTTEQSSNLINDEVLYIDNKNIKIDYSIELPKITNTDNSSITFLFDKDKKYYFQMVYSIPNDFYEKNFTKEQISQWKKDGYELFTGTLKSNKVRIYNLEELICK